MHRISAKITRLFTLWTFQRSTPNSIQRIQLSEFNSANSIQRSNYPLIRIYNSELINICNSELIDICSSELINICNLFLNQTNSVRQLPPQTRADHATADKTDTHALSGRVSKRIVGSPSIPQYTYLSILKIYSSILQEIYSPMSPRATCAPPPQTPLCPRARTL